MQPIAEGPSRTTGLPSEQRQRSGPPFPYGVNFGGGTSMGPNLGSPSSEGVSYSRDGDIGWGPAVGGSISLGENSAGANTGVGNVGGGDGFSLGFDFCVTTNLICNK